MLNSPFHQAIQRKRSSGSGGVLLTLAGLILLVSSLPVQADDFTEQFTGAAADVFDLSNKSILFKPNGLGGYGACASTIANLPTDPAGGTNLFLTDDSFAQINLSGGATVSFFGTNYATFYVGSNGYITFDSGDGTYSESLGVHFGLKRISALFDDLNPGVAGAVSWKQLPDRVTVTWLNIPEFGTTNANTFQIEMYFNGQIFINWTAVASVDNIVGLSKGTGLPPGFVETNFSAAAICLVCGDPLNFELGLGTLTINNTFGAGNGLWHLSTACQSSTIGHSTPTTLFYGVNATCNYDAGNTEGVVTSSSLSLVGTTAPKLSFKYYLQTEGAPSTWDMATVEVSQNSGAFNRVAANAPAAGSVTLTDPSGSWLSASVDLSPMIGSSIQFRFRFRTVDSVANQFAGFYIDDVTICDTGCAVFPATPTNGQADPPLICSGQCSTLSATVGADETVDWFTGSCGGIFISSGTSPVVCPTTTTTYYARARKTSTGCISSACAEVTVAVNAIPAAPTSMQANPPGILCAGACTTLSAVAGAGETVEWHIGSCEDTLVPGGATPNVCPETTTTYFARARNIVTDCVSASCSAFTVTASTPPIPTNPNPIQDSNKSTPPIILSWNNPPPCGLTNGGFELGTFSGWTTATGTGEALTPWQIVTGSGSGWFANGTPFEGASYVENGFDGEAGLTYDLYREVYIPTGTSTAELQWRERIQWDLVSACNGCSQAREYTVTLQPSGGGVPLATLYSATLNPQTQGDTGYVPHIVNLITAAPAISGTIVRINWHESIPETFTGPAQFDLDGVSMSCSEAPLGGGVAQSATTNVLAAASNYMPQNPHMVAAYKAIRSGELDTNEIHKPTNPENADFIEVGKKSEPIVQAGSNSVQSAVSPSNVAIFQDQNPWGSSANQTILTANGITYTIFDSTAMGTVNLLSFNKVVISSAQPAAFYAALEANRDWFEAYVSTGGVLDLHLASLAGTDSTDGKVMPGGFVTARLNVENIAVADVNHTVVTTPHPIADADLTGWSPSTYGYFAIAPNGAHEIVEIFGSGQPCAMDLHFGAGRIFATVQTVESTSASINYLENTLLDASIPSNECLTTYDVLFDATNPPTTLICDHIAATAFNPGPLAPGIYYWQVVANNCCGSVPGPVWSFSTLQSPEITAWKSIRTHSGLGDLSIVLNPAASGNGSSGPTVETRNGGIQRIEVDFNSPVTLVNSAGVTVSGWTTSAGVMGGAVTYTPASVSMVDADTMQILFNVSALPDESCYTINIASSVQNSAGLDLSGDTDCNVRALIGDANGSGVVDISDQLVVKLKIGMFAQDFPESDLNRSGGITVSDQLLVKSRTTAIGKMALCP